MADRIPLLCIQCGNAMLVDKIDVPRRTVRVESHPCDLCDDGGGYGEELYIDAAGKMIDPEEDYDHDR